MLDEYLGERQNNGDSKMSPPGSVFLELGIGNQSDCAIRSIDASKPCGLNVQLQPMTEYWEQTTGSGNIFKRRPRFRGTVDNGRNRKTGVCSTCFAPCSNCKARHDMQSHSRSEHSLPPKRYLSCAYVDLPSLQTYKIGIEFPTTNSPESDGLIPDQSIPKPGDYKNTSDATTQTDGLPDRVSNMRIDHDVYTPVEFDLKIGEELDPQNRSSSGSFANDVLSDEAAQDVSDPGSRSSSDQDGEKTRSSAITRLDQDNTWLAIEEEHTRDVFDDKDLLLSSVPTADMFQEAEQNLFDLTEGEEDHLMRMNAVFGAPPRRAPLDQQEEMLPVDSSQGEDLFAEHQVEADWTSTQVDSEPRRGAFQLNDSLDITPEEFEQFMAMNEAFGGPAVIPPPKYLSQDSQTPSSGLSRQPSTQQTDNQVGRSGSFESTIVLPDNFDLSQEQYEQVVAVTSGFDGPTVIPPPRMASREEESPSEEVRSPVSRPLTLDLKVATKPDGDRTPSPRSPGLSRQSAVSYLRLTDSSSSTDDNSRQNSMEVIFRDDLEETSLGIELNSDGEEGSDEDEASLVASSQEDEGSLTPIIGNSFDHMEVKNPDSKSTTPTNESQRIPKEPEFLEDLFLSAPSGEGYGENAVLMRCKIDAWPAPLVSWFYKDELLGDDNRAVDPDRVELTVDEEEGVHTLLLKEVEGFDTGVYTCRASNAIGEAASAAELIVQESVSDSEYETARSYFTSGDEIYSHPYDTWSLRGIGDEVGAVPKRTVRITTHGATPPRFAFKPQSRVVEIGQTARLICGIKGSPKPRVSWFSEGVELKNEGRYRVFESEEPGNFVLEIREVRPTDAGTYTCTAGNIIGQVYCSSELSVEEFGEPEVDVKIVEDEMTSLPVQYLQYGPDIKNEDEEGLEAPPPQEEAQPVIPQKLFAMEGETTKLLCSVVGHERSTVSWYKDTCREAVVSDDYRVLSIEGDNCLLTFLKTRLEDEGEYRCCLREPPHTLLCSCKLVVKEAEKDADERDCPTSSTPLASAPLGSTRSSSLEDETRLSELKQTKVKHTDSLEVVNPLHFSPIYDDNDSRNAGNTNSSHGSGEGPAIKWREKPPYASPRKHKENRKSRKSGRGGKHSADSSKYHYSRYDSSDSDSSSDGVVRPWKEKSPNRKVKPPRKSRNSYTSDEEFDTGLERIMALSEKADACLNIVNSVLEMTSLDKEVDEALQEQIYALQPGVRESEGNGRGPDNTGETVVDSEADVDFIKQMAAQTVANAIAAQMMREANSLQIEPKRSEESPQENGFSPADPETKESSEEEIGRTSKEEDQDLSLSNPVDPPPIHYTTTAQVQESSLSILNETDQADLKLNADVSHDTTPAMSPRNRLFRGPKDKIFTLDEILDCLPETAVDENPNQNPGSASPDDETQKFTLLDRYSPTETPNSVDSEPTDSPLEEFPPKILTPLKDTFVLEGDAMRLEVQIGGFPVPEVTWYRDGTELRQGKNLQLRFDGEDTWALIIRNIPAREGGVYTCSATNKLGSSSTRGVIAVAGLADGPDATDGDEEGSISKDEYPLSPAISVSSPSAMEDDVFVKPQVTEALPRILLNENETIIDGVTPGHSGDGDFQELTAHLTDAFHLDRNFNWADESSPDISRSNSNNSDKGTAIRLVKRNRPDSNIEIIRHRKAFRKHPSRDSMTSTEPCSTGNSTSESDTEGAPKFTQPLQTTEILEGESVQFDVCVSGEPEPMVRWFHDGTELKGTDRIKCSRVDNTGDSYWWRLEITKVRTVDDGRYVCKAENSVGIKSCFAFLIVEALNATDGTAEDNSIVSRLLKEREEELSLDESSSQIEEDLLKSFTVESDYSDSSGRMSVKKGDQVELLDGRSKDRWLVRHKTNSNMIGYIPCTLLKRSPSSASEKEDKKILYTFISRQGSDRRPSNSMKQRPRIIRHLSLKEGQLSELDEGKMIEDFSDTEAAQSYDLYMAVASYTPAAEQKGFISMTENQVFEVLDSNSALNWLVRGESSDIGWVPASYLTPYVSSSHNGTRRGSRSLWEEQDGMEMEEAEEGTEEVGSKEKEAMIKRGYVLKELLDTERDFVKDLKYVTTRFIPPIQHPNVPIILKGKKDDIFCNIKEIYEFHNTKFLHELEECENDANSIGRAFIKWQSTFIDLHVMYCKNKPKADTVLTPAAKAFFLQYGGGTGPGQLGLGDYLIKPVQRITKYQLLLKEIIKYTSRAKEDCQELEMALNGMIEVPKRANDLMHLNLIEGFQRDVTELGKLYRQDSFSAWNGKPKGRGKERYLFLFKDILLLTKPKKEVKGDIVGYLYKSHLMVSALNVSEDQSDERRFELSQGRLAPLTLLAKTKYVKEAWVKSLHDLIAEVPKDLREGKSSSERRFDHSPLIMRKRRAASMLSSRSSVTSLLEPGLNGNFSKSTESLTSLISGSTLLSLPRSGRGSIDSMTGSVDLSVFSALVPSVGSTYEVLEDLVADGHEMKEILKGDAVKLLEVCDNNLFHIQTIPSNESSQGMEGYVAPGLVKKMNLAEEFPAFTERLKSCLVNTDDSAILTCSFTGRPSPTASWSLPRHLTTDNKRLEIVNTEDSSTLTLHRVTMLDAGEFTCTVENSSGLLCCTARLDIRGSQSSSLSPADLSLDSVHDTPGVRSSSPLNAHSPSPDEPSMVRSSSLENLKTLDDDFDVSPGEIVRASSVSGRGMLNSSKKSGMDKIGSFRKHFRKAFSTVGMERDKIFANLQRSQSGSSLQKSKHQQRSTTCIYCKALRDDGGEDGHAVCETCAQRAMAGSRETLMEEEEDAAVK